MSRFIAPLVLIIALVDASGQMGPTVIGCTYATPVGQQVIIAPGQIATLQVTGLKTSLSQPITTNYTPLPTVLAGISVTIEQDVYGVVTALHAPLLSVAPAGAITSITVEIPIDTTPLLIYDVFPVSYLVVSEGGRDSQPFFIVSHPANTHVVTGCGGLQLTCVTHADGSFITGGSPAKAGETIVIYAYGLGQTNPPVPTGTVTPMPAPLAANAVYVDFNFSPNAGPRYPYVDPKQGPVNVPAFAGLTPGQIGLYQINVKLPDTFPAISACSSNFSPYYSAVESNLTIDITTYFIDFGTLSNEAGPSFDAAAICVQPAPMQ